MPYNNKKGTFHHIYCLSVEKYEYSADFQNRLRMFVVQQIKTKQTKKSGLFIRRGTMKLCTEICILTPNGRMSIFLNAVTQWTEVMLMNPLVLLTTALFFLRSCTRYVTASSFLLFLSLPLSVYPQGTSHYSRSGISEKHTWA